MSLGTESEKLLIMVFTLYLFEWWFTMNLEFRIHSLYTVILLFFCDICGPGSSVRIVTGYWLDSPGIDPCGGEIFCTCPDRPWGPPSLLYNGYGVFPGGKELPGRVADPSPPSSAAGHERVELYLYSPYGPLWPVQSLSACTRVSFTFL